MSQPEESRPKTDETDDVVMRPHQDPNRRSAEMPPVDEPGEVRVERDGTLRPLTPEERGEAS